ncbi:TetR/AcrR family transcriptional regulator [Enterococcus mundtii]|uniref:HTH tetR-type domain-containing protein n=1 Tax=Enterococcus mundtii TaxID=53346 RepID=A0A2T5D9C4_ENTMU|nr:TetR/AcrR family transcriptional regulator [Enterococcus mundtii]PTO34196.1 hypothetical protein C6N14_13410 [Enterococcus mundtii]
MSNHDVKKIIENAFLRLLQERSYEQITVSTIVENAFVSRTTFYNYFKNKDDVLLSVLDDFYQNLISSKKRI